MCKFCETNTVIVPDEGPQLEFSIENRKFGDMIKLSINSYRKEMNVKIDKFQHPDIVEKMCFMYNMGLLDPINDWPKPRYAVWKIKYCPFCGKKLNEDEAN